MPEGLSDFTGERLVPGAVENDLWNEHVARYLFAQSLSKPEDRVIDAGCGTGYGSAMLAQKAASVTGIDISPEAVEYASAHYAGSNVHFFQGSCESLPVESQSANLVVAFEVIEHLTGWRAFLAEAERILAPGGIFLVSTPNRDSYNESRGEAGPNPFHVHEFDLEEFSSELALRFPHTRLFSQNHSDSIVFSEQSDAPVNATIGDMAATQEAAFFIAVCGDRELPSIPNFVYIPRAADALRERAHHIHLLDAELTTLSAHFRELQSALERSNTWAHSLDEETKRQGGVIAGLQVELERSNTWAHSLDAEIKRQGGVIDDLQVELERSNTWAESLNRELAASGVRIAGLQTELEDANRWARTLDQESEERGARVVALQQELAKEQTRAAAVIAERDITIEERTAWALNLQAHIDHLSARLQAFEQSRWVKAGRRLRLGPPE